MSIAAILAIIEHALGIVLPEAENIAQQVEASGQDSAAHTAVVAHLKDAHAAVLKAKDAAPAPTAAPVDAAAPA